MRFVYLQYERILKAVLVFNTNTRQVRVLFQPQSHVILLHINDQRTPPPQTLNMFMFASTADCSSCFTYEYLMRS